ncbi:MAG: PAS-domain containing protein [bacterium]
MIGRKRTITKRKMASRLLTASALMPCLISGTAMAQYQAEKAGLIAGLDPTTITIGGAILLAIGAVTYALRVSKHSQNMALNWSKKLTRMEAKFDKSESILAAHPGLVLVWDDSFQDIEAGWGAPRILGGPAAMASLLTFADDSIDALERPADALLNALGELPLEEDVPPEEVQKLQDKVNALRLHGVAFSGAVVTDEGRSIEVDGRVAGDQATLWITDPAVRLGDDAGVVGQARDRAADLHGALNQLDRLPMASWRRGPDLNIEWVNSAYVEMVEAINLQEVVENQIEIDSAFRALAERAKAEFTRSGRRIVDDIVKVNIRGMRRVFRIFEQPMHGVGESGMGGMAIDITKLDKAQENLRRHQQVHRNTLDHMPAAVAVFNAAQQIDYYNQAFLDLWKLDDGGLRSRPSHGEILDKLRHTGQLPAQEDFNSWKEQQLALYTQGPGEDSSVDGAAPDEIWTLPSNKTLRVVRQRHPLGGVLVVFEDITEKLNLEREFNTQISVQRATLNNLAEGVAVFASDGKLRLFNSAFQKLWHLDEEKLSDLPEFSTLTKIFDKLANNAADDWKTLRKRIIALSPEDRRPIQNAELSLKDGRSFAYSTSPLPDGATLVTFLDVTDSREREKELKERNEWLETADRIKTRFVNHISYNLRNPLNTIIGFSEMLETEMFGTLNERQKEYAANILTASNHLLDLINDIIDLAAIDAGKLNLDLEKIDVYSTLSSTATYAALKAEDSQVKLSVKCDENIGSIIADGKRLKQLLFNLLANAFAFTDEGGKVVLGADRDGDTVRIWVKDSGRGIPVDEQAKAFDRFESQGPSSGAGLGLSLVKSFVELHGGWVRLSSCKPGGTMVSCHLPAAGPDIKSKTDNSPAIATDSELTAPEMHAAE